MRTKSIGLAVASGLLFVAMALGQEGKVLVARSITLPSDCSFGDATLAKGTYRIALTEVGTEKWFVLSKAGKEVARDIAVELPSSELPTTGLRAEMLKGNEYFRVRVGQGGKVYLVHFLLKGGKA
jgi:hypothetical protein